MRGLGFPLAAVANEDFLAERLQGLQQQLGAAVVGVFRLGVQVVVVDDSRHERLRGDVEEVLASLSGKKIGYQNGTTGGMYIEGDEDWGFNGFSNVEGVGYNTAQLAAQDIVNGNIYAVVVDDAPAAAIVSAMNN